MRRGLYWYTGRVRCGSVRRCGGSACGLLGRDRQLGLLPAGFVGWLGRHGFLLGHQPVVCASEQHTATAEYIGHTTHTTHTTHVPSRPLTEERCCRMRCRFSAKASTNCWPITFFAVVALSPHTPPQITPSCRVACARVVCVCGGAHVSCRVRVRVRRCVCGTCFGWRGGRASTSSPWWRRA